MVQGKAIAIFWFRRDLRLEDNIGLFHALNSGFAVLPIFIFDTTILGKLENKYDRRIDYICQSLNEINRLLRIEGSSICSFYGKPLDIFKMLYDIYDVKEVYCNCDYEPYAIQRDLEILEFSKNRSIRFNAYKDQVIFDKNDVVKSDGTPYTVYTAYANKWKTNLVPELYKSVKLNLGCIIQRSYEEIHSLQEIGFEKTDVIFTKPLLDQRVINNYDKKRDLLSENGTTKLSMALRFGTISIRKCVAFAVQYNQTWLSELIWREFFMQILYHFPYVVERCFKGKYNFIRWRNNEQEFKLWCEGQTGIPLVDAGMRQLNQTGFMHNRARMVVASFLVKNLLIDWRWGEAYFAEKLNDYDLSANNGNWQWVAGCGCDAAPYFRIFNPISQAVKFDKNSKYIRQWVPEIDTGKYPEPMVNLKDSRNKALIEYKAALTNPNPYY